MKILNLVLFLSMVTMMHADLDHACAYSNESVAKFRRQSVGHSIHDALKYCIAENMIGSGKIYFSWPVDMCEFWISSKFGPRTHHGVTTLHGGIDLAALKGSDVKAAAPGKVIRVQNHAPGYGHMIEILHKGSIVTRYGHLHTILVQQGDKVSRGDIIATVGSTGNVRGKSDPSHLHFEIVDKHGNRVDPLKYLYCSEVAFKKA